MVSSVRREAAISASTEFLEPLTRTLPCSGTPPWITKRSTLGAPESSQDHALRARQVGSELNRAGTGRGKAFPNQNGLSLT